MKTGGVFNHCRVNGAPSEFSGHLLCEGFDLLRVFRLLQLPEVFDQLVSKRGIATPECLNGFSHSSQTTTAISAFAHRCQAFLEFFFTRHLE